MMPIKNIKIIFPSKGPILPVVIKAILSLEDSYGKHLYFRGEKKKYPYVIPSLYRENNEKLVFEGSEYYYRSLMSELGRDDYSESSSLVRMIAEFRHYGAVTRIIDISKNPLAALYFAIEDEGNDGYVYVFESDRKEEKFDTGHTIAIKTALNLIPQKSIDSFIQACKKVIDLKKYNDKTIKDYFMNSTTTKDISEERDKIFMKIFDKKTTSNYEKNVVNELTRIQNFMSILNQRARVRETLRYPFKIYKDLSQSHIFISSKNTDRITRQRGAFIFPQYVNTLEFQKDYSKIQQKIQDSIFEHLYSGEKGNLITIPSKYKGQLRKELYQLGIDGGFLYSDIQHQSDTLLSELDF